MKSILVACAGSLLVACAAPSTQQVDARDREGEYERAYADFRTAEKEYLNLLFNLETHPEDAYLLEQRQIKRKEVEQMRNLMMQSRSEFDDAVIKWEDYLRELRSVQKEKPLPPGQPTSPGHLVEPPRRF